MHSYRNLFGQQIFIRICIYSSERHCTPANTVSEMAINFSDKEVSRIQIGFLGIDIVTVTGARAAAHAIATGDLVRVGEAVPIEQIQWPIRRYFNLSRFGSPSHGLFLPMRPEKDEAYASRKHLEAAFAPDVYPALHRHAVETARLLIDPHNLPDDKTLGGAFAHAIADRFGIFPDDIADAAANQTEGILDSFKPWTVLRGKPALEKVYKYVEESIVKDRGIPKESVVDFAHAILAPFVNGPSVLREVARDPYKPTDKLFTDLGKVEQVMRMTTRETTLGGMLPKNNPVLPRYTIVRVNISEASKETGDLAWSFGSGTTHRRCAAEDEILRYTHMVQEELIRLRNDK